jgi:hypothetical protein
MIVGSVGLARGVGLGNAFDIAKVRRHVGYDPAPNTYPVALRAWRRLVAS